MQEEFNKQVYNGDNSRHLFQNKSFVASTFVTTLKTNQVILVSVEKNIMCVGYNII